MLARSFDPDAVRTAKQLLEVEIATLQRVKRPQPRVLFAADEAEAIVALAGNDPKGAEKHFQDGL